jgi:DNA primase
MTEKTEKKETTMQEPKMQEPKIQESKIQEPQNKKSVYQRYIELATLTEEDKKSLKKKRGFSDDTINTFRFVSGGPYISKITNQLIREYSEQELIESGIVVETNGTITPNSQLLDKRIIIPYIDENGNVYHLRPHKLGFHGIPPQPYCRFMLKDKPEHIVLTEGEFKAAALWQWGIPAMAIPGISSFSGKHFDRFVNLLKEFEIKKITIIYDNEEKGNPAYPNFKEKAEDRYDTLFWAYIMAWKLNRAGFITHIGMLPSAWRENGKIDFDMALAQGRTRKDIERVIASAKTYSEFLAGLEGEALKVVRRKVSKYFAKTNIRREFNKYVAVRTSQKGDYEETISNFVINIKSSFYTPDGVVRNVEFVNEYGEKSDVFPLHPSDMAGLNEFKKFCFSKGNYLFKGRTEDLLNIWESEFLRDSGELIYMPEKIGRIEDDLWLFGNMAIKGGKVYRPDNDGIIWIDGKGYKPQSLQINPRGEPIEDAIPSLCEQEINIVDVALKLKQTIGGYEAYMGLGWVVATIFSDDIFKHYKCFPILFPHGKRMSGKSTFLRWLMSFFGVETEGYGLAETSQNFIARALSYFSSLGVWFDEYRNETKITQKDGFFRSAYNRQLSGKGTATAFQARGYAVNAAIAISGEELPKDNGLFTRCIPIQISAYKRDRTWFDWFNKYCYQFSNFTYHLIKNYDKYKDRILENIQELKEVLVEADITDRTAENWAICAAAFESTILQDEDFIRWVFETCQDIKITGEQEHMLNMFWEDVIYLVAKNEITDNEIKIDDVNNTMYIWFNGIYNTWSVYYRKKTGNQPFDKQSISKYLQDEPYYNGKKNVKFGKTTRYSYVIDLTKAPDTFNEIVDVILEKTMEQTPTFTLTN